MPFVHITGADAWAAAKRLGRCEAPSLVKQGCIHCSGAGQVVRVADNLFRGQSGLVLLCVNIAKLTAPVVYENLDGGAELFPHVDGPIDVDAVKAVLPFEPAADGTFGHHAPHLAAWEEDGGAVVPPSVPRITGRGRGPG